MEPFFVFQVSRFSNIYLNLSQMMLFVFPDFLCLHISRFSVWACGAWTNSGTTACLHYLCYSFLSQLWPKIG